MHFSTTIRSTALARPQPSSRSRVDSSGSSRTATEDAGEPRLIVRAEPAPATARPDHAASDHPGNRRPLPRSSVGSEPGPRVPAICKCSVVIRCRGERELPPAQEKVSDIGGLRVQLVIVTALVVQNKRPVSLIADMATFVLVHGAFEGGWCWSRVARLLRAAGHEVHTPTLTGCGERFHLLSRSVSLELYIADVSAVLRYESLVDVILVGHSFGGTVATGVADRERERIRRVVYLDASAPVEGQSASGAFAEGTADKLREMSASEGWLLPPLPARAVGVTNPLDVALLAALRHPHPLHTLSEPLRLQHGETKIPRTYVTCARHEGLTELFGVDPLTPFVDRARREGWDMREINAGHDVMLSRARTSTGKVAEISVPIQTARDRSSPVGSPRAWRGMSRTNAGSCSMRPHLQPWSRSGAA